METYRGSKISNAPEMNNFSTSFMRLKLRRALKEDYMEVGESEVGTGLQDS